MRSVEESPRPAWQLPGCVQILLAWGCPGPLPMQWVRAQPWGVPTHSRILMGPFQLGRFCASTTQSLPVPPCSSWRCFVFHGSSVLPDGWNGHKELFPSFPTESCKEAFPTGWICKGRLKRRDHRLGREALHPRVFAEGSWGLCSSSGVVAGEFLEIIPI